MFSWGCNKYGKLGVGSDTLTCTFIPIKVKLPSVKSIRCGQNHSLALTFEGEVFGWGSGETGELGNGLADNCNHPTKTVFPISVSRIVRIAAGAAHSVFLTAAQRLLSCGDNQYSQTGLSIKLFGRHVLLPTVVPGLEGVTQIECGDTHSIALNQSGVVLSWGLAEYGQTGVVLRETQRCVEMPTKVNLKGKAEKVFAGSLQSFCLLEGGQLYGWGLNDQLQLGIKSEEEVVHSPRLVEVKHNTGKTKLKLKVGCSHSIMLMKSTNGSRVVGWGLNKHGQLGPSAKEALLPELLPYFGEDEVSGFAVGGYHTAFILN